MTSVDRDNVTVLDVIYLSAAEAFRSDATRGGG